MGNRKKRDSNQANTSFDTESNHEISKLVQKRDLLKAKLNSFSTFFDNIKETTPNESKLVEVELRISTLESKLLSEFSDIQLELESLDSNTFSYSEIESFECLYYAKISEAKQFLTCQRQQPATADNKLFQASKRSGARLPVIELPKFRGTCEKWLEFKDLFTSLVHNCDYMDPIDKFHYLRSSLEGSAARCIESIEFCANNYNLAWDILLTRFENKGLMVHNYIRALFNIKPIDSSLPSAFRDLVDTLSKNLKCLESLGVEVNSWDPLLIYLVISKLDSNTIKEWGKQEFSNDLPTLLDLKSFLSNQADILDKVIMHKAKPKEREGITKNNKTFMVHSGAPGNKKGISCYYCKKPHLIYKCFDFKALPHKQKIQIITDLNLCTNCLQGGHDVTRCKFGHCKYCNEKHNSLLHSFQITESSSVGAAPDSGLGLGTSPGSSLVPIQSTEKSSNESVTNSCCNHVAEGQVLLATALVHIYGQDGRPHVVRAMLDSASMSNFITQDTISRLGIKTDRVNFSVFGIGQSSSSVNTACSVQFSSCNDNQKINLSCLVIPNITGNLPSLYFDPKLITIPKNVLLADPTFYKPSKVDLLLGANIFWDLIKAGKIHLGKNRPVIQETKLGWIISGSLGISNKNASSCHFLQSSDHSSEIQRQLSKFWEIEEVSYNPLLSSEESLAEDHFVKTHTRNSEGRFIVSIPLKASASVLGDSKQTAKRQFLNLERKFVGQPKLKQMYVDFMKEYNELSHMSLYNPSENEHVFYSPHHGVLREESVTTKLRVVFNCSAISTSGESYNSIQMVGPTVQDDLQSILLRFRQHAYVFSADMCKMYRQILVKEEFRPLQLILWRSDPEASLQTFALNTVTYGTTSAPFLATRCIKQLAVEFESQLPLASKVVGRDFYVDDLLSGADTIEEAISLCHDVCLILESGCFELRKWKSNNSNILNYIKANSDSTDVHQFSAPEACKTLGMVWSCVNDTLSFQINCSQLIGKVTKRVILSETAKIFDPLGLVSPVVVTAKIMLQSLWLFKLSWEEEVPVELGRKWVQFRADLQNLNSMKIQRHVSSKYPAFIELHGFSDASKDAYGACVYIRTIDLDGSIHTQLLNSKTRVSPLKTLSTPRLELCAAVLLAKLYEKVTKSFTISFSQYFLWSDSTVALSWIRTSPHLLQVFVGNRVSVIQSLTDITNWKYVPTESNPADILSRGMSAKLLLTCKLWFHGPPWLSESSDSWPQDISLQNPLSLNQLPEVRKQTQSLPIQVNESLYPFSRFSSLTRIKRSTAFCLRFIHNCRTSKDKRKIGVLSLDELNQSMNLLVKLSQGESFPEEVKNLAVGKSVSKKSNILSLTPFMDEGLIRVGGRLKNSAFCFNKKHPLVLSSKHHLTYLIFNHTHISLLHCGAQLLLANVREQYWATSGKNLAKRIVRDCVICFKCKPYSPQRIMGNLPEPRVTANPPFFHTGLDYAGPFLIKDRKGRGCKIQKCYLCIFVCLAVKAVHLELVTDLSTSLFLETFQRFIARRGKPSHVYSDNGRNFLGACNELKDLGRFLQSNCNLLAESSENSSGIKWHFIPAYAPHQGGLWEAGVKAAKFHIKRVLLGRLLTFENLYTVITQIESILNSRPLTPMSSDPNDLEALTPSHFLIGRSLQAIPYPDLHDIPINRQTHFQQLEGIKQNFWSRWSKEYIAQLQERTKWKTNKGNITLGDMVLVRDDTIPSYKWQLGRVIKVHPGTDQIVRVVSIKTSNGVIKRATTKVCPLPT